MKKVKYIATFLALAFLPTIYSQVPSGVPWATPDGKIVQLGILAATCGAAEAMPAAERFTFGLLDVRGADGAPRPTSGADSASLWYPSMYHHPDWTVDKIGNVFGICFDGEGNIYVAASSSYPWYNYDIYGVNSYGSIGGGANSLQAAGTVYKIDKTTGIPTAFAVLPQQITDLFHSSVARSSGPGLGDVCYDSSNNQFFVSNFEDGKIYRVSAVGAILGSFDPLNPDDGAPGMAPRSERVWAVQVYQGRLYYSLWDKVSGGSQYSPIRSVGISTSGFASDDREEFTGADANYSPAFGRPISDISFDAETGKMMLAQRSMELSTDNENDVRAYNHLGNVYIVQRDAGGAWNSQYIVQPGHNNREGYGGADWMKTTTGNKYIWSSSADMLTGEGPHGLQGWKLEDSTMNQTLPWAKSVMVPYFPQAWTPETVDSKGFGGDVEIYQLNQLSGCVITTINVTPGACNNNGTPNNSTDDYYTASVTVNYTNPPATGSLVLSGPALHSSNTVTTVSVGSLNSSTSHTFTGVRLVANGTTPSLTAKFQ